MTQASSTRPGARVEVVINADVLQEYSEGGVKFGCIDVIPLF
jgi:hypothetical protein